ncbi:MAG: hypothetical protein MZU97_03630 [Bacillus subtilis]|nr:hypothetical protein [Bacillus subtilis]
MIAANSEIVLIGMPTPTQIELVLAAAKRAEPTLRLSYLVIPGLHLDIVELMTKIRQIAPEMVVVTDIKNLHFFDLEHLQTSIYRIGENNHQLTLANGRVLQFIPSPYILSAGSFLTYDPTSQTLFSNHLFANPSAAEATPIEYQHQSLKYLSARLPSSDFVRLTTKKIQTLAIQRIVTGYGNVLEEFQAKANIESTNAFDFYNLGASLNRALPDPSIISRSRIKSSVNFVRFLAPKRSSRFSQTVKSSTIQSPTKSNRAVKSRSEFGIVSST